MKNTKKRTKSILDALKGRELTASELSSITGESTRTIRYYATLLENQGLVVRRPDMYDLRSHIYRRRVALES